MLLSKDGDVGVLVTLFPHIKIKDKMETIEGLIIINKYTTEKYLSAEHDQIWFGSYEETIGKMTIDEKTKLEESDWFEDEDSWSHFT